MSGHVGGDAHSCPSCLENERRERNYEEARATHIRVQCTKCGEPVVETLGTLMSDRGLVRCSAHGGRKVVRR